MAEYIAHDCAKVNWVIVGGESGSKASPRTRCGASATRTTRNPVPARRPSASGQVILLLYTALTTSCDCSTYPPPP